MIHARKNDELDFPKIKNFCSAKATGKRIRSQDTDWRRIFSDSISDKRFILRIYKELSKFYYKKSNDSI